MREAARVWLISSLMVLALFVTGVAVRGAGRDALPPAWQATVQAGGFVVPANAADEKNPLTVNDAVLASGKRLFGDKCARCHGVRGRGDGPEGDESRQQDMDLTVAARAARNPDGVVFYKIWNGRPSAKMEGQSASLTKEQVWSIVAYVQTLRARAGDAR
jgi:mono/diheme cytochrome c family protein